MGSALIGNWDVQIATPVGRLAVAMTFVDSAGEIVGSASGRGEDVALENVKTEPAPDGESVTWTQSITKPLRLTLAFSVIVDGDNMTGTSRAGRLPSSKVVGTRKGTPS